MIANIVPLDEWSRSRMGCITSSEVAVLFAEGSRKMTQQELDARERGPKGGLLDKRTTITSPDILSEGCKTYLREKVTELLTGTVRVFDTYATEWGKQMEPRAVELLTPLYPGLEYHGDSEKWFCGFIGRSGGSPDVTCKPLKLIGEVKCPENSTNHLDHLLLNSGDELKEWNKDYWYQIQMNGLVVSNHWKIPFSDTKLIFASYGDLFPDHLKLKVIEIEPCLDFAESLVKKLEISFDYMRSVRDLLKVA